MIKKTITFNDYNGQKHTKDFMFNLNKIELTSLALGNEDGDLEAYIKRIIDSKDNIKLMNLFQKIILMSYGVKSEDGLRFIKSEELSEQFSQTEAYVELYVELCTNETAAANFIKGIVPEDLAKQIG